MSVLFRGFTVVHCLIKELTVSVHDMCQGLLSELVVNCDGELKAEVTQMAAYYEHRLQLGSKPIFHIEAFIAKFMSIYKRFLEEGLACLL